MWASRGDATAPLFGLDAAGKIAGIRVVGIAGLCGR
jgi:hypothetical protein